MSLQLERVTYFQHEPIPDHAQLAGWSALVQGLEISVPVRHPSCVSTRHIKNSIRETSHWRIFDKRYAPAATTLDHLIFALRHESIDLLVLKRALERIPPEDLCSFIRATPTGALARRIWFFYETLTGQLLDLEDAPPVAAVDVLDQEMYFTGRVRFSSRHRVRNNLLGGGGFCPIIRRTEKLQQLIDCDLANQAAVTVGRTGTHLLSRAASFMLLADSRASFAIEGERAPRTRLERWGRAVLEAGKRPLNQTEIYRLHRILIGDDRFTQIGYRTTGVFLGERDHNNEPLPEFIGARPEDLPDLMLQLNTCNNELRTSDLDPVLQAAVLAFGFVYIHPLEDGNGRLHRCLIHHVLAERRFAPQGMVFPVSSVMLDRIDRYRVVLQTHTAPLLEHIEWQPTADKNVEVLNDTADFYRYFDVTEAAEFLYDCVRQTVEHDLPREISYLQAHDAAAQAIMELVEMPDRLAADIILFIRQNNGKFPKNRRKKEFEALTDKELASIEEIVKDAFPDHSAKFSHEA